MERSEERRRPSGAHNSEVGRSLVFNLDLAGASASVPSLLLRALLSFLYDTTNCGEIMMDNIMHVSLVCILEYVQYYVYTCWSLLSLFDHSR